MFPLNAIAIKCSEKSFILSAERKRESLQVLAAESKGIKKIFNSNSSSSFSTEKREGKQSKK